MNEELSNFYVRFTTEGITELKAGLKDVQESVDKLDKDLKKSKGSGDDFFKQFKSWANSVGLVTAAFVALKEAVKGAIDVSGQIQDIYKESDISGTDPETLERWGILARMYRGTQGDANQFFRGLNDLALNLRENKYSEDMLERMARAGFSMQYLQGAGLPENRDALISKLNQVFNRKDLDAADLAAVKQLFNISDTMYDILKANPDALRKNLQWAEGQRALTADPAYLENSIELNKTLIELKQELTRTFADFMPVVTELLEAVKPLLAPLKELGSAITRLLVALMPIIKWIVDKVGGGIGGLADSIKLLTGGMTLDEFDEKYSNDEGFMGSVWRGGKKAGEWLGDKLYSWGKKIKQNEAAWDEKVFGNVPTSAPTRTSTTNLTTNNISRPTINVAPGTYNSPTTIDLNTNTVTQGGRVTPIMNSTKG